MNIPTKFENFILIGNYKFKQNCRCRVSRVGKYIYIYDLETMSLEVVRLDKSSPDNTTQSNQQHNGGKSTAEQIQTTSGNTEPREKS
jgi:hypothetical protein